MRYKMIAIDMDGTLLNSRNQISVRNQDALRKAMNRGTKIVISTGRILTSAVYYAKLLDLTTPIIACNGAYVAEHHRNNIISESAIKFEDFKNIINIIEKYGFYYHFYDSKNFYTKELSNAALKYYEWNKKLNLENKINIEIFSDIDKLQNNLMPYKILVISKDKIKLVELKNILMKNYDIELSSSWDNNIEIMNRGVSKGKALKEIGEFYNINKEEIIAIGDNYNDISMFKFAGTSVAMGNADEELKEMVDIVTDTNDNDGVAKAIEKLIY